MSIRIIRQLIMPFLFIFLLLRFLSCTAFRRRTIGGMGFSSSGGFFSSPMTSFCRIFSRIPDSKITQYHIAMNVRVCQYVFVNLYSNFVLVRNSSAFGRTVTASAHEEPPSARGGCLSPCSVKKLPRPHFCSFRDSFRVFCVQL